MNETTEIFISRLEQVRKEKGLTQTKLVLPNQLCLVTSDAKEYLEAIY